MSFFNKIRFVEQQEHSECALACIVMILNYFKFNVSLDSLRNKYSIPKGGNNLIQIQNIFEDFNINTKAYKTNDISKLKAITKFYPCICLWNNNHFVILEKIKSNKVKIVDPAIGKINISLNEFKKNFSNIIMVIEKVNLNTNNISINKNSNNIIKNLILNSKIKFILILLFSLIIQIVTLTAPLLYRRLIDNNFIIISDCRQKSYSKKLHMPFVYSLYISNNRNIYSQIKYKIYLWIGYNKLDKQIWEMI